MQEGARATRRSRAGAPACARGCWFRTRAQPRPAPARARPPAAPRLLAARVRVLLGVQHQDVDVLARGQHVVHARVPDLRAGCTQGGDGRRRGPGRVGLRGGLAHPLWLRCSRNAGAPHRRQGAGHARQGAGRPRTPAAAHVVRPAVAAHDPHRGLVQAVGVVLWAGWGVMRRRGRKRFGSRAEPWLGGGWVGGAARPAQAAAAGLQPAPRCRRHAPAAPQPIQAALQRSLPQPLTRKKAMAPCALVLSVVARWPSGPIASSAAVTALAAAPAMAPLSCGRRERGRAGARS